MTAAAELPIDIGVKPVCEVLGEAVATLLDEERGLVVGHHEAARPAAVDALLPVRAARHLQPPRRWLDDRRP